MKNILPAILRTLGLRLLLEPTELENQLISILIKHCGQRGDSEGAVETLNRIIMERDAFMFRTGPKTDACDCDHYPCRHESDRQSGKTDG